MSLTRMSKIFVIVGTPSFSAWVHVIHFPIRVTRHIVIQYRFSNVFRIFSKVTIVVSKGVALITSLLCKKTISFRFVVVLKCEKHKFVEVIARKASNSRSFNVCNALHVEIRVNIKCMQTKNKKNKKHVTRWALHLSPQYSHMIPVSRYIVLTAFNWP